MRFAILVNLDYQNYSYELCRFLWNELRVKMVNAGFLLDGRIFTIDLPPAEASNLARKVIESMNEDIEEYDYPEFYGKDIYSFIKEFYGFDLSNTVNLLLPPVEHIQVVEG
jgi:hypothetical protein